MVEFTGESYSFSDVVCDFCFSAVFKKKITEEFLYLARYLENKSI